MFGDRKAMGETGFDEQEPTFVFDKETLKILVGTIIRKSET